MNDEGRVMVRAFRKEWQSGERFVNVIQEFWD
jgi:hypothetical protein